MGAVTMNMINNTNITSTSGVTLISAIGARRSLPELKAIFSPGFHPNLAHPRGEKTQPLRFQYILSIILISSAEKLSISVDMAFMRVRK
jgi:hypothetical protein